jgi:hypothetical protein
MDRKQLKAVSHQKSTSLESLKSIPFFTPRVEESLQDWSMGIFEAPNAAFDWKFPRAASFGCE